MGLTDGSKNTASQFDDIYNSTHRSVLAFITVKCGNTADIQDIFQETYLEFYKLLEKRGAEYVTNGKALIMRIAKRKLARYYSLMARIKNSVVPITIRDSDTSDIEFTDAEARAFIQEDFSDNLILLTDAKDFMQKKSDDIKKIFYLFYTLDLTIAEIAKELSISESNVKHKLYRTLNELRKLY